ncbi:MAG TPA: alpha-hydroxy acid oxidase [Gammaproteobacteria bacterium]|nr:alpha-hydroxy acid oxidase [Gammaproteobacteria bacterium]
MNEKSNDFQLFHELYKAAKENLAEGTWDYLIGGAETETTFKRNRAAFDSIAFRPRVLRDVDDLDTSATLLGQKLRIPVVLAPIGSLQDFHPEGGAAVARAADRFGTISILSSVSHPGLETTAAACNGPKIFQLYVRGDEAWVEDHIHRATDAGYVAFCFTVDLDYYVKRERDISKRYVTTGRRLAGRNEEYQRRFSWKDIARIRERFEIPLILKGIATAEDARLAVEHGIEVVYVSNHGGRELDHGRGALDVLPEVVDAVSGRAEIVMDGGIMRGSDVVKAMALGADAVGIARLYGFALGAAGEPGVTRALEILENEIRSTLGLLGVTGWSELDQSYLHPGAPLVRDPGYGSAFPLLEEGY